MMIRIFAIIMLSITLMFWYTTPTIAQPGKPEFVQEFEDDLFNTDGGETFKNSVIKRIDASQYADFNLKWKGKSGDVACLVYQAVDPDQDEQPRGTKIKNIAIKLVRKDGSWIVNSTNVMPGDKVEAYDFWLRTQGCKED